MVNIFGELNENNRLEASDMLDRLKVFLPKMKQFEQTILELKKQLATVESEPEFFILVKKVLNIKNQVRELFASIKFDMQENELVADAVQNYLKDHSKLSALFLGLHPELILKEDIIAVRKKLAARNKFSELSLEKLEIAENFIANLKELKSLANSLLLRIEQLQEEIDHISTSEELDVMENEIEAQKASIETYSKLTYPEDPEILNAIKEFVAQDPELSKTIRTLDLHETLMDDILRKRFSLEIANLSVSAHSKTH